MYIMQLPLLYINMRQPDDQSKIPNLESAMLVQEAQISATLAYIPSISC